MQFNTTSQHQGLFQQFKNLFFFRFLFIELIRSEIVLRYRRSFLGVAWTVLNPIFLAVVLYYLFRAIFKFRTLGETDFFPYVYCGVLLLTFITRAIVEGSEQIHVSAGVLRRIRFPSEILVLSKVSGNLINLFLGLLPLILYLLFTNGLVGWRLFLLPLVFIPVFLIVSSIAIMLSVAYVFFRDIEHLMPTLLNILFYISPVFYSIDLIGGNTRFLVELNPLNNILESFRYLFGAGLVFHPAYLLASSIFGFLLFCTSLRVMEVNRMRVILVS